MNLPNLYHNYWNNQGKYQDDADRLSRLIPASGPVSEGNPALEKYRQACNCYYDLYNNGLCNRAVEFRKIFKFGKKQLNDSPILYAEKLELEMDKIILKAKAEQFGQ